jgi:predicted nucleic acid-binding OB-fold protein
MSLSMSLISVKRIECDVPRSQFDESLIEDAARSILEIEGTIAPVIVKRKGLRDYILVAGYLTYYAAVKAKEIDSLKGEVIGAFIIDAEHEEAYLTQLTRLFSSHQSVVEKISVDPIDTGGGSKAITKDKNIVIEKKGSSSQDSLLADRITNLERQLLNKFDETLAKLGSDRQHQHEIEKLQKELDRRDPLKLFNEGTTIAITDALQSIGIPPKKAVEKAAAIVEERDKNGVFASLAEISDRVKITRSPKKTPEIVLKKEKICDLIDRQLIS